MALVEFTVDTDNSGSPDYTQLSTWESTEQTDLVTATDWYHVACSGATADDPVAIVGWTMSSSYYIRITGNRSTQATYDTDYYHIETLNTNAVHIGANGDDHIYLDKLQCDIRNTSSNNNGGVIMNSSSATIVEISDCILWQDVGVDSNGLGNAVYMANMASGDCYVWNCIIYDFDAGNGFNANDNGSTLHVANCTVEGCKKGYDRNAGTFICYNSIASNINTADFEGTFDAASDYNYADDSTAPGANSKDGSVDGMVSFEDAASNDYRLKSDDTVCYNNGTSDPLSGKYSDDFIGTSRPQGGSWDIGAFEREVTAGIPVHSMDYHLMGVR